MKNAKRRSFIKNSLQVAGLAAISSCSINSFRSQKSSTQRKREYNILDFGAVGDGKKLNTLTIQKTIDACANVGGGQVVIPSGTFLTGTIFLKDNINLHLKENAVLLGSPWIKNYPPQKPTKKMRYEEFLNTSLIFAQGVRGISVTGKGTLDGNTRGDNDFHEEIEKHRPTLIWFEECTDVHVKDITFTSAGFWTEAYTLCKNVHVDGITVTNNTFRNNDGCDIVDCENFIVENCDIDTLDDAICLKSYTTTGCKNIIVRNNKVRSLCNGIKAGTDSSGGGFQNILIENNKIWQTGIAGIALEIVDGGVMRNVVIKNIEMDVVETPIFIKLSDRNRPIYIDGQETESSTGIMQDIRISGIRATVDNSLKLRDKGKHFYNFPPYTNSITGIPGHYPERIYMDDIHIEILGGFPNGTIEDSLREIPENSKDYPENNMFGVLPSYGFFIRHVKDIKMTNVRVTIKQQDDRPAFILDDVHNSEFHGIKTESITPTETFSINENCKGIQIKN